MGLFFTDKATRALHALQSLGFQMSTNWTATNLVLKQLSRQKPNDSVRQPQSRQNDKTNSKAFSDNYDCVTELFQNLCFSTEPHVDTQNQRAHEEAQNEKTKIGHWPFLF